MAMVQPNKDRWARLRERLRDAARLPIIVLLIFTSGIAAWLGCWFVWRTGEWAFHKFLSESWLG